MAIERHFLGWDEPALPTVADYLLARYRLGQAWDLAGVVLVLPGQRAGRRLLELLVEKSELHQLALIPPTITTEGRLPERLYQPKRPLASDLVQQLAWLKALRQMPDDRRRHFLPQPPSEHDDKAWLRLASLMQNLHKELAANGLDCGHVRSKGKAVVGFDEAERWKSLAQLQQAYLRELDAIDVWDIQTARLVAIEQREFQADFDIVLVGAVDLNVALRKILDQVSDRVTALVHAPSECASDFDKHGCVVAARWQTREIPIQDTQILRADGPSEQADVVTRWLAELSGKYCSDEISIGVPDAAIVPQLQRQLSQCGVASRWVEGLRLAESAPYRLLEVVAQYGARRRFADLAALVRHVDVQHWLAAKLRDDNDASLDPLIALDEYYADHLPTRLDSGRLQREVDKLNELGDASPRQLRTRQVATTTLAIVRHLDELLDGLSDQDRPLSQWAVKLQQIVSAIYADQQVDRKTPTGRYLFEACVQVNDELAAIADLPSAVEPSVSLSVATALVLEPLKAAAIAPQAEVAAVELLGWLELPLDDAPALIVTTFNDGAVPKSASADPFLPNKLRKHLGLLDNERRFARDSYALTVLQRSRRQFALVVASRDAENTPLPPSRLLFASDDETIARRSLRMFSQLKSTPVRSLWPEAIDPPRQSHFVIPQPNLTDRQPLDRLTVTQFKSYLACPYRFYLRHVLRLRSICDSAAELDAAAFGNLLHGVLEHFGRSDDAIRHTTKPDDLLDYLSLRLDSLALARFSEHLGRPAIRVQVEQARSRLRAFAQWQTERTIDGWRIAYSEDSESKNFTTMFEVDSQPFQLQGRIDRIDHNLRTGEYAILDYKTSDHANTPEKAHRKSSGEWVDLQLPLYRHLLSAVSLPDRLQFHALPPDRLQLGYINLPKDLSAVGLSLAEWRPALLDEADELARNVIRNVRTNRYWPPTDEPPPFSEELAAICHDRLLNPWRPEALA